VGVVLTIMYYACDMPWACSTALGVPWALARKGAFYDVVRFTTNVGDKGSFVEVSTRLLY
jgi:hypothetical protein